MTRYPEQQPARRRLPLLLFPLVLSLGACNNGPETKVDPEAQLRLHRELALRWYQMNELDRAEDQVDKGLALEPGDPQLQMMLGWIRLRRGRVEDVLVAERVFRELAEEDDFRAYLGLGGALERKGLSYLENSEAQGAPAQQAELARKGRKALAESIESYEKTLELQPGNARALSGLQRAFSHLGEYQKSLEYSRAHREVVNEERTFHRRQLNAADLTAEEEDRLRRLVETDEEALIANDLHAVPLMLTLHLDQQALERLDEVLSIDPDEADAHALRAQALMALGRFADARASIDDFLALSTDLDYEHPDVQRAFALREECDRALKPQ